MNILIADDHSVVRTGVKQIIQDALPETECIDVASADDALASITEHNCDVAILDLNMPGATGLDLITRVRAIRPQLPILVLSMHPVDQFATRAQAIGANGYLSKETAPEQLVSAILAVVEGEDFVCFPDTDSAADESDVDNELVLSKRETEVVQLLFEGKPLKEIGAVLGLSPKTVSTYRQRILSKLGLTSNAELVQYLLGHNLGFGGTEK